MEPTIQIGPIPGGGNMGDFRPRTAGKINHITAIYPCNLGVFCACVDSKG
jgi:hypothetical protein